LSAPDLIAASKCWASWKYRGTGLVRSIVITLGAATAFAAVWCSCIRLVIQLPSVLRDPCPGPGLVAQVSRVVCSNIILTA